MLKKILFDPLLHFILIAVALFIIFDTMNPNTSDAQTITVNESRLENINNSFTNRWNRPPSDKELNDAIHAFIINQAYIKQAKTLGLDKDDAVIDKRLRQKMEYILEDMAHSQLPSETVLVDFHKTNADKYLAPAKYSFLQTYISIDRPKDEFHDILKLQDKRIKDGLAPTGDRSLIQREYILESETLLKRSFGEEFLLALEELPLNVWTGPVESALGIHYILLKERHSKAVKEFSHVKTKVLEDWQYENTQVLKKVYEQQLLELYDVTIATTNESID